MAQAKRDSNRVTTIIGVSNADMSTPALIAVDPATGRLLVSGSFSASLAGDPIPISGATTAVSVAIVDGSGNQITSFGGGTQYVEDVASAGGESMTLMGAIRRDDGSIATTNTDGDYSSISVDSRGAVRTVGNVASGATDVGNPVKVAGIYKATPDTLTDGQRSNLTVTTRGALKTTLFTNDSTTTVAALATNADAVATTSTVNTLSTSDYNRVYNGTTWDRQAGTTLGTNTLPTPSGATTQAPSNTTTTAYAASLVVKASAGTLYGMTGINTNAAARFVQVHNTTSLPADTSVPVITMRITTNQNFSLDFGVYGRRFSTGITVALSTTGATLTIAGADMWVDAQYV